MLSIYTRIRSQYLYHCFDLFRSEWLKSVGYFVVVVVVVVTSTGYHIHIEGPVVAHVTVVFKHVTHWDQSKHVGRTTW